MPVRPNLLPFALPDIGGDEEREVIEALRSGWVTTGPKAAAFEEEFAARVGAECALATNSCTAALHLALLTAGIGPGSVVLTTPFTFVSTIHVVVQAGAEPLLVDVDPDTLNLDVEATARAVNQNPNRVAAIMPVHFAGRAADMASLAELASSNGLALIEDAAHAFPASTPEGHQVGRPHDGVDVSLTAFSFYATKTITTGEGGMLTGDRAAIDEARIWALHGMSRDAWRRYGGGSWRYDVDRVGFKYNLSDLLAAMGLAQLRRADILHRRRIAIAERYSEELSDVPGLQLPPPHRYPTDAAHLYVVRVRREKFGCSRDEFIEHMRSENISTSVHFIPVPHFSAYRNRFGPSHLPNAYAAAQEVVSLPIYSSMSDSDVGDVIQAVRSVSLRCRSGR